MITILNIYHKNQEQKKETDACHIASPSAPIFSPHSGLPFPILMSSVTYATNVVTKAKGIQIINCILLDDTFKTTLWPQIFLNRALFKTWLLTKAFACACMRDTLNLRAHSLYFTLLIQFSPSSPISKGSIVIKIPFTTESSEQRFAIFGRQPANLLYILSHKLLQKVLIPALC